MRRRKRAQLARQEPVRRPPVLPEDVPEGLTLAEMQAVRGERFDSVREGTGGVYTKHLKYFEEWFKGRGLDQSLVDTENIDASLVDTHYLQVYLRDMRVTMGLSLSSVGCAVAAVRKCLEWEGLLDQVDWGEVGKQVRQYRKDDPYQPAGVDGITRSRFELILASAWLRRPGEWPEKTARRAALDIALISLMRDCLLRRVEAAAVTWGDIKIEKVRVREPGGRTRLHVFGVLTIPFGKTDRHGNREVGYIDIETLARLQKMAVLCGRDPSRDGEKVFGIGEKQVANRIIAACKHAGLSGPGLSGHYAGHSCRVGMAMDLAMNNTSLVGIMQSGRWRIPKTVMRYIKAIAAGDGAVARLYANLYAALNREEAPRQVA